MNDTIVGIHQPNFLPWIGFFYKILRSDIFVFLDNVQLPIGRSFCYRNKIKTPNGELWLSIPISRAGKSLKDLLINQVEIDNSQHWREKHLKTLEMNYKKAKFFQEVFSEIERIYYSQSWQNLSDLNISLIKAIVLYLDLSKTFVKSSALGIQAKSTELLIQIVKKLGGNVYLSGLGGGKYQDEGLFKKAEIKLEYYDFHHPAYTQLWGGFIPNLSITDLLFNLGQKSLDIIRNSGAMQYGPQC
jgi:hypothetical protein